MTYISLSSNFASLEHEAQREGSQAEIYIPTKSDAMVGMVVEHRHGSRF